MVSNLADVIVTLHPDTATRALLAIRDATASFQRDEWGMAALLRTVHGLAVEALREVETESKERA